MKKSEKRGMIFAAHPQRNTLFFTSDDQAFYESHDAKLHAETLEDKKVECVQREEAEELKIAAADESVQAAEMANKASLEKASLINRYKGAFGAEPTEGMTAAEMEAEIANKDAEKGSQLNIKAEGTEALPKTNELPAGQLAADAPKAPAKKKKAASKPANSGESK